MNVGGGDWGAHCPLGREVSHVISLLLVRFSTLYVEK